MLGESKISKVIKKIAEVMMYVSVVSVIVIGILGHVLQKNEDYTAIEGEWVDQQGNPNDLRSFKKHDGESVYTTLDNVGDNQILVYSARNIYTDIYVDGKLASKDDQEQLTVFGSSPGTRWRMVTLNPSDKPVEIRIDVYNCFSNTSGYINKCYVGEMSAVYTRILSSNLVNFILGFMWVMLGLICIFVYIVAHKKFALEKDFLYLSVGTLFCAVWCSAETNFWQFFVGYSELVHLVSYLALFIIPIPFALLLCYRLEGKWRKASYVYAVLVELNAIIAFVLNMTGIMEYHYTAFSERILFALVFPFSMKLIYGYSTRKKAQKFVKYLILGFALLVAFIAVGIIYYALGEYMIYTSFIRWALFFLLFILFGYQFTGMSDVFVKGLQAEFLQEMALMDHLTKFYNRSGFAKHRENYDNPKTPIGVIQFDVNNLKSVNDNQGHEKGDELICLASSGIYQSFSSSGFCYRMGGDEFLVVLTGEDPEGDYYKGVKLLEEYCNYANSVEDRSFDVKIAHGFTMKRDDETFNNAVERADSLMYENKKMMKANNK